MRPSRHASDGRRRTIGLTIANAVPLVGVVLSEWTLGTILLIYWAEAVLYALDLVARLVVQTHPDEPRAAVATVDSRLLPAELRITHEGLTVGTLAGFGLACALALYGGLLWGTLDEVALLPTEIVEPVVVGSAGFAVARVVSFGRHLRTGGFADPDLTATVRGVGGHLLVLCTIPSPLAIALVVGGVPLAAVFLVAIKTATDLWYERGRDGVRVGNQMDDGGSDPDETDDGGSDSDETDDASSGATEYEVGPLSLTVRKGDEDDGESGQDDGERGQNGQGDATDAEDDDATDEGDRPDRVQWVRPGWPAVGLGVVANALAVTGTAVLGWTATTLFVLFSIEWFVALTVDKYRRLRRADLPVDGVRAAARTGREAVQWIGPLWAIPSFGLGLVRSVVETELPATPFATPLTLASFAVAAGTVVGTAGAAPYATPAEPPEDHVQLPHPIASGLAIALAVALTLPVAAVPAIPLALAAGVNACLDVNVYLWAQRSLDSAPSGSPHRR